MKDNAVRRAIDNGLKDLHMNDRERAQMLDAIIRQEEECTVNQAAKRRIGLAGAIVAAVLMTVTVAVAAQSWGWINWNGEWEENDAHRAVAPTPTPEMEDMSRFEDVNALLSEVPAGEYWAVWDERGGRGQFGFLGETVESTEEVAAHLAGRQVLVPGAPAGYTLQSAYLDYNRMLLWNELAEPYESTPLEAGGTLNKYKLRAVTDDDLEGYTLFFVNGEEMLTVSAYWFRLEEMEPEDRDGAFFVDEGEQYEMLALEGFQSALAITRADGVRDIYLQADAGEGYAVRYQIYAGSDDIDVAALFGR